MSKNLFGIKTFAFLVASLGLFLGVFGQGAGATEDCGNNFGANFVYEGMLSSSSATTGIAIPINSDFRTGLSLVAQGDDNVDLGDNVDIVLVMDRSGSMGWVAEGIVKLIQAKNALNQVASIFQEENNSLNRLALVTYNSSVTLDQPLTSNYDLVESAIESFSAGGSTNIGGALSVAANHLRNSGNEDSKKFIVFASDGVHNTGTPVSQGIGRVGEDVTVFSVGIGDPSYYNEGVLKAIASAGSGKGEYYSSSVSDLVETFEEIIKSILTPFRPENIRLSFFQKNTDKFSLLGSDPTFNEASGGKIDWNNLGSMTNDQERSFEIDFRQAAGYGMGLELNESFVEVSYDLFGKNCRESVSIDVIEIDNLPKCTGPIPLNASLCPGDDLGLTADAPNKLVESCSSSQKCEYVCNSPLEYKNGVCVMHGKCGDLEAQEWCRSLPKGFSFCSSGFLVDGPNPNGNRWSWLCSGIFGGDNSFCSAYRLCPHNWKEVTP